MVVALVRGTQVRLAVVPRLAKRSWADRVLTGGRDGRAPMAADFATLRIAWSVSLLPTSHGPQRSLTTRAASASFRRLEG